MKINQAQAQKLETYGFKWAFRDYAGGTSTDLVEGGGIKSIVPTEEGFVIVYDDKSFLICSACSVEEVDWRDDPSQQWILVYWTKLENLRRRKPLTKRELRLPIVERSS